MKHFFRIAFFLCIPVVINAQITRKVCFLGNSYIYTNDMPGLVSNLAIADGNTLIKDQNTPGGYTLEAHSTNPTSLAKITANQWDFVVLQDQSQIPSFPWSQVVTDVLPFAEILCDSIRGANDCAIPLFFDTWGRQNGDPQWDSIDTFTEMNQRLYNAYSFMANANSGMLAPVGIAFEHIANDISPSVSFASLYNADESHPTIYGSYLTACIFYELIFEINPVGNSYFPAGITSPQAAYLQTVAHHVLNDIDSIETAYIFPEANFSYSLNGLEAAFINESMHAFTWLWNFGDGNLSMVENPNHVYDTEGSYVVELIATYCDNSDTVEFLVAITNLSNNELSPSASLIAFPNPSANGAVQISSNTNERLDIYTLDGKLVQSILLPENEVISIQLSSGTYLLQTKTSNLWLLVR